MSQSPSSSPHSNTPSPSSRRSSRQHSDINLASEKLHENDMLDQLSKLDLNDMRALQRMHAAQDSAIVGMPQKQAALNEQAAEYYEKAACQCTDPAEVEKLKQLAQHYRQQARLKRSFADQEQLQQQQQQQHHLNDRKQPLAETTTANWFGSGAALKSGHFGAVSAVQQQTQQPSSTSAAQQSGNSLQQELHSLFLLPWEQFYASHQATADPAILADMQQVMLKTQQNFAILMRIASMGHDASQTQQRVTSPTQTSQQELTMQLRLQQLAHSLDRVQLERLKTEVQDVRKQLEEERRQKAKYQKEPHRHGQSRPIVGENGKVILNGSGSFYGAPPSTLQERSHSNLTADMAHGSDGIGDTVSPLHSSFYGDPLNQHMIFSKDNKTSVTLEDFELLKVIGRGNFAKVLQVRKKDTGKIYAMKILNKTKLAESDQVEHIKTERAVMQYVEHPFLVNLVYAFQTKEKLYMIMDFVNGGELFFHLKREKRFAEMRVKFYAAELFLALDHIHRHNVVYRDLKPENVLMNREGHVMLTDFGLAKILSNHDRTHTFCVDGSSLISLGNGLSRPIASIVDSLLLGDASCSVIAEDGSRLVSASQQTIQAWGQSKHDVCVNGKPSQYILRGEDRVCVRVTLEDGRTLELTPDHEILAIGPDAASIESDQHHDSSVYQFGSLGLAKWIPAGQLQPSIHRIVCSALHSVVDEPAQDLAPEYASFKLEFADSKQSWSIIDAAQRDKILAFARLCGLALQQQSATGLVFSNEMDLIQAIADISLVAGAAPVCDERSVELSSALQAMLRSVCSGCCAAIAGLPHIPDFVLRSDCPKSVIREFLAAYWGVAVSAPVFAADGTIQLPALAKTVEISGAQSHKQVAETMAQLKSLFARLDVNLDVSVQDELIVASDELKAHGCKVSINASTTQKDAVSFVENIGIRYNADKLRSWTAFLVADKARPRSIASFLSEIGFVQDRYSFALAVSHVSSELAARRVYDITVDCKSFAANGIIVHNCGTPEYLAPEVLLQQGHGKPVDWWSYGTLLYEMLVGIPPFYSENVQEMYDMILHADLIIPERLMTVEAQDLLARLLERNPKRRIGTNNSDEIRNHPWFRDISWDDVYHKRIPPPFVPQVKDDLDLSYFDEEFTRQAPEDSYDDHAGNFLGESVQKEFEGFTYTGKSKLAQSETLEQAPFLSPVPFL